MNQRRLLHGTFATAAAAAALAASSTTNAAAPASDAAVRAIEEVVVTATRRSESVQEVPVAVSAYDGDRLRDAQLDSLTDLESLTPNVEISGAFTNASVAIRGIGNAQVLAGSESGVAVHADGAFLGQPLLTLSTFLDVARVEVLRGPQGTLFGRNATGGAINVVPATPTRELEVGLSAAGSVGPGELRTAGHVSGPLRDDGRLLGRLAAQHTTNRGFFDNEAASGPGELQDPRNRSVRAQLEWLPTETFGTRLSVEHQRASDHGPAAFLLGTPDPSQPLPPPLQGLPTGDPDDREAFANVGGREIDALALTSVSTWSTPHGDLKVLGFLNRSDIDVVQDGDGTAADFTRTGYENDGDAVFAEIVWTSDPARAFSYVLGANVYREDLEQEVTVPILGLPFPVNLGGELETRSRAAFATGKLAFARRFELFGGARYTRDEKDVSEFNVFFGTQEQDERKSELTWEIGLAFHPTDDVSTYVKRSTGFKGGGFSVGSLTPAFDPETNVNLEVGVKSRLLDGALQADLAAFHMTYEDLQVNQVIGVQSVVTNAAEATIDGAELELRYAATDRLRIEATASWLDATFDEFTSVDSARPALGALDLSGNHLPTAPEHSGSLGVYYAQPAGRGELTWGARYDWKSRVYYSEFNLPVSSQRPVGTLDLSLVWRSPDLRWTASVFALNATDEAVLGNVLVASAVVGSLALGQYEPGRQVGASLEYRL